MDASFMNDQPLHINAGPLTSRDVAMWDDSSDKILLSEDIATPTTNEPFFDAEFGASGVPSPVRMEGWNGDQERCMYENGALLNGMPILWHAPTGVEPTSEPCSEEIPWNELVYWLGNATTGQVECSCAKCSHERSLGRNPAPDHAYVPSSVYKRLAAKIPVIRVPRIEGVN